MPYDFEVVLFDCMYLAGSLWFPSIKSAFDEAGHPAGYRPVAWGGRDEWRGDVYPTIELASRALLSHVRQLAGYDVCLRNVQGVAIHA